MTQNRNCDVAAEYAQALAARLGDNLVRLSLFGSRARGDHRVRSDFDLMVVLARADRDARSAVHRLATEFELDRNVDLSTKITNAAGFAMLYASALPFWRRFRRDERLLWPMSSARA
ncbi:MAG: nucleotidyltransferase domain-containing protein [Myxococcota bacterium]